MFIIDIIRYVHTYLFIIIIKTYIYIYIYIYIHIHTYIHTYIHTHTQSISQKWVNPLHFSKKKYHFSRDNTAQMKLGYFYSSQCAACIEVHIYCPLNITQHITIIVKITGNKNEYTLSEHVKMCPKCQYLLGAPLLSSTALILLAM